jgi:hypothetical protein
MKAFRNPQGFREMWVCEARKRGCGILTFLEDLLRAENSLPAVNSLETVSSSVVSRGMKHLGINGGAFVGNNAEDLLRLLIALGPTSMVLN